MRNPSTSAPSDTSRKTPPKRRSEFAAEMRAKGFKRVVRWVPDVSNPDAKAEYLRQLAVLAEHQRRNGAVDFLPPDEDVPGWS